MSDAFKAPRPLRGGNGGGLAGDCGPASRDSFNAEFAFRLSQATDEQLMRFLDLVIERGQFTEELKALKARLRNRGGPGHE